MNKKIIDIEDELLTKLNEIKNENKILYEIVGPIFSREPIDLFVVILNVIYFRVGNSKLNLTTDIRNLFYKIITESEVSSNIVLDLNAIKNRDPAARSFFNIILNYKGFHAVTFHRIIHQLWLNKNYDLALYLANISSLIFSIDIHPAAIISGGLMIDHGTGVVIGETAVIEQNVTILQGVTLGGTGKHRGDRHPKIKRGVLIGAGAKILGNITIGVNSKIGAGSVVLRDIPANSTAVGIPAKTVKNQTNVVPSEVIEHV